ncbi:MAG: hypothetical protein MKZ60_01800 [Candidatus Thalassarchaeum sp.]|nr:hypothetical protein [Candidatus Thalassarchaeum sp.]
MGPTEKRRSELVGGLYLVGARGKFCALITERQLTIERFDGKGVRLDLSAIDRMRHLKIPMLPSGSILLGLIAIYLGITTIVAPISWLAVGTGASIILANVVSRYSILAIETGSGDRHLVSGSESNLLKLCLIVDRVRHGSPIEEALLGLENLESEVPVFPSIRDATGQLGQQSQVSLPEYFPPMDLAQERKEDLQAETGFGIEEKSDFFSFPSVEDFSKPEEVREPEIREASHAQESGSSTKQNAYERAWGVTEAPNWYQEKEEPSISDNRIDTAFSDAAKGLDMFSPGGLFDSEASTESVGNDMGLFDFDRDVVAVQEVDKLQSSAQMIKRAHEEFGAPSEPYSGALLPPPTDEAVRKECRAGVVRQARARQELRSRRSSELGIQTTNLEDYPALNKLASTMTGTGATKSIRRRGSSGGWLSRLLSPSSSLDGRVSGKRTSSEIETERFQTSQHMRLRSDQDHQAELTSRIRTMRNTNIGSSTAKDKLDSIVRNLSGERNENAVTIDGPNDSLKFSQLKPTSSRDDPNPLPGLRRLG